MWLTPNLDKTEAQPFPSSVTPPKHPEYWEVISWHFHREDGITFDRALQVTAIITKHQWRLGIPWRGLLTVSVVYMCGS